MADPKDEAKRFHETHIRPLEKFGAERLSDMSDDVGASYAGLMEEKRWIESGEEQRQSKDVEKELEYERGRPDDSYRNAKDVGEHWKIAAKHYPQSKSREDKSDDRER